MSSSTPPLSVLQTPTATQQAPLTSPCFSSGTTAAQSSSSPPLPVLTLNQAKNTLHNRFKRLLARRESHSVRRRLTLSQPNTVDFSSNDFLSLSTSPLLRDAYIKEFTSPTTSILPLGSGGSRLLDGNSTYAEQIEREIASFHNAETGLLFNSGYDANSGLFGCIPQAGDVVLYDEYVHASTHEGMRLSRAYSRSTSSSRASAPALSSTSTTSSTSSAPPSTSNDVQNRNGERPAVRAHEGGCFSFRHNSLESFSEALSTHASHLRNDPTRHVFVAVESVYSMDGDVAPLASLLDLLDHHLPLGNGHLIVDEAHSTGVYGTCGRGLVCALGLEQRVFARLHTFGKALSGGGAIVLGSPELRDYLVNYARSLIYTTSLGLPTLVSIKAVYGLMMRGETQLLQQQLWELVEYLHNLLQRRLGNSSLTNPEHENGDYGRGDDVQSSRNTLPAASLPSSTLPLPLRISSKRPQSPIFSLLTSHPRDLARVCQERGYMARPIVAPTVPEGTERVRICLHAGNTRAQIEGLVDVIVGWVSSCSSSPSSSPNITRSSKL